MDRFVMAGGSSLDSSKFEPRKPQSLMGAWKELNQVGYNTGGNPFSVESRMRLSTMSNTFTLHIGEIDMQGESGTVYLYAGSKKMATANLQRGFTGGAVKFLDVISPAPDVIDKINFEFQDCSANIKRITLVHGDTAIPWEEIYGEDTELLSTKDMTNNNVIEHNWGGYSRTFRVEDLLVSASPKKGGRHEQGQVRDSEAINWRRFCDKSLRDSNITLFKRTGGTGHEGPDRWRSEAGGLCNRRPRLCRRVRRRCSKAGILMLQRSRGMWLPINIFSKWRSHIIHIPRLRLGNGLQNFVYESVLEKRILSLKGNTLDRKEAVA